MRTDPTRAKDAEAKKPWKLLLWTAVASLVFGLIGFGEIVEDQLRTMRNSLHQSKASGDIVFVAIDDRSLREVGDWPWRRELHARLVERTTALGARRIFLDTLHEGATDPRNDLALATALRNSRRVVMPARERFGTKDEHQQINSLPLPIFLEHTDVASVSLFYNYQHAVWKLPYSARIGERPVPTFSAALAGDQKLANADYRIDYSINPASVPYVSASDLLAGRVQASSLRGKQVVIGADADQIGDEYWVPGRGRMAGAMVHILGAETLKSGQPTDFSFWPAWFLAVAIGGLALLSSRTRYRPILLAASITSLLIGPTLLESQLVFVDVMPGIFALLIVSFRIAWLRWRSGSYTNSLTGLPNFAALRGERHAANQALVAARVHNYAEIASALNGRDETALALQIVQRLSVSGGARVKVFQGDEGLFVWFADPGAPLANHLEALHSLFRSPLSIGGASIDVALTFGVELGSSRTLTNRLGSALVAADEAWADGLKWKYHDPARQEEVSWRLSLLGQLDAAIDNGEVWIAYQPQYDLRRKQIIGAEALARWTHPEKGPISPTEFVAAAEQQGRIGKLTDFVLDRAIATAAAINRRGTEFTIAVNISARMLTDRDLIERVSRLLKIHGLQPERLTLELTETEALHGTDGGIAVLDALYARGVRIAIDDYGTGLSTLEYLKKIPADEIKIDQSFVKAMRVNRSDLIMVQSTIALAHSLGRSVVAEGVEDRQLLDQLAEMQCDVAQGYAIGRPMGVKELVQRLQVRAARKVA